MPETEPKLLVPPRLVSTLLEELKLSGAIPAFWHVNGRFGSRVAAHASSGRRTIPVSPAAYQALSRCLQGHETALPARLQAILRTDGVELTTLLCTPPRVPKLEELDGTIHAELYQETSASPAASIGDAFTYAELFAGIGGFGQGLNALGGRCVFASEIAPAASELFALNSPANAPIVVGDIWQIGSEDIPPHDLLVAGFPCQPFSTLGLQPGLADAKGPSSGRGMLFSQIVRVLEARRPSAFLLENVPGVPVMPAL